MFRRLEMKIVFYGKLLFSLNGFLRLLYIVLICCIFCMIVIVFLVVFGGRDEFLNSLLNVWNRFFRNCFIFFFLSEVILLFMVLI